MNYKIRIWHEMGGSRRHPEWMLCTRKSRKLDVQPLSPRSLRANNQRVLIHLFECQEIASMCFIREGLGMALLNFIPGIFRLYMLATLYAIYIFPDFRGSVFEHAACKHQGQEGEGQHAADVVTAIF